MQSTLGPWLGRLAICGLLGLSALATACSDDGGDDEPASPAPSDEVAEWCEAARQVTNAVPTQLLERTEAAAAVAPDDLEADYDVMVEYLEYERENPTDAVGIAERKPAMLDSLVRIAAALQAECGISTEL